MQNQLIEHRAVKVGSDRSFGLVFAVVFAVIGLMPFISRGEVRWWALAISVAFLLMALVASHLLGPLNRLWHRIGLAMHVIVTPLIMAILFFGAVLPMAILLKVFGKELLRLRRQPEATTYWIARDPPGPEPRSFSRQF